MSVSAPLASQRHTKRAAWQRKLIGWIKGNQVIQITGFIRRETVEGLFFEPAPTKKSSNGLRWASTKKYSLTSTYAKDEILYVNTANDAVITGAIDGDSHIRVYSPPGNWICLQSATPDHIPQWPCPTPDDPDAANNYWWPMNAPLNCP